MGWTKTAGRLNWRMLDRLGSRSADSENKDKGGWRGLRPWPLRCLSQILSEREERMLRLLSFGVPFSAGLAVYL